MIEGRVEEACKRGEEMDRRRKRNRFIAPVEDGREGGERGRQKLEDSPPLYQ